jgi:hypothetical protein
VLGVEAAPLIDSRKLSVGAIVALTALACGGSPDVVEPEAGSVSSVTVAIETAGPGGSFTTPWEALVRLRAEVSPMDLPVQLQWMVTDNPADRVPTPAPQGPLNGSPTWFLVPRPNAERWAAFDHPGELDQKSLSLRIRARVVTSSDTVLSETAEVTQDEIDTVRQEYGDLRRRKFPGRDVWGTRSSPHFKPSELNPTGDYSLYWVEGRLLDGLEALRAVVAERFEIAGLPFQGLVPTSVFRNPVHHSLHAGLKTTESPHQYGLAADMRIWGYGLTREEFFAELREAAATDRVAACFEPEDLIRRGSADGQTLTHAHVDWRAPCPTGW